MGKICLGCMEEYGDQLTICPHCGYEEGTPAMELYHLKPGTILGDRYLIGRVLGFGSFGVTYIGFDQKLNRKVAIKEYLPGEFSTRTPGEKEVTSYSGESREQFLAGKEMLLEEARKLGKFLSEPEIIHVYDSFEENMTAYIVMEYLEGESLKDKLEREGALSPDQSLAIILQVLDGLSKIHAFGMLHRDVAPDNIYITKDGKAKLFDFGAARYATSKHSRSLTVQIKSGFTPIEQYQSHGNQGPWTDVYAAAATYYKMLTNVTPEESMLRKVKDSLVFPSKMGVKLKKSIETALMNALNVEPERRTVSAEVFKNELLAEEVKRLKDNKKKADIGLWPPWVKVLIAIGVLGVSSFIFLLVTGVIQFSIAKPAADNVPEGKVRLPNMINMEVKDAVEQADMLGFMVKIQDKEYSEEIPVDKILSQTIQGGALIDEKSEVGIVVSAGVQQTFVPNLIGLTKQSAEELLLESGLKVEFKEQESWMEPETVCGQNLEPDTVLDTGALLEVFISKGKEGGNPSISMEAPDITGLDIKEAGSIAETNHFYLARKELVYRQDVPSGIIISQFPEAGSQLFQNSSVLFVISGGAEKVFVPDVQYMDLEEAEAKVLQAGLEVSMIYEPSTSVDEGKVIRQDVPSNTRIDKNSVVQVVVSSGIPIQEDQQEQNPSANQNSRQPAERQTEPRRETTAVPEPEPQYEPQTEPWTEPQTEPQIQETQPEDFNAEDLEERLRNLGL